MGMIKWPSEVYLRALRKMIRWLSFHGCLRGKGSIDILFCWKLRVVCGLIEKKTQKGKVMCPDWNRNTHRMHY